jgi:hypothetical protein
MEGRAVGHNFERDPPRDHPYQVWFNSLKPLNQIKTNLAEMVLEWSPFNFVSDSPALHSKWLLLLKIEISSIVHGGELRCSGRQAVPAPHVAPVMLLLL